MKITIDKISIRNFRKIVELDLEFGPGENWIRGRNSSGKSSVLDAITWGLFGKDYKDRKNFAVLPINPDQSIQKVAAEVTITMTVDGNTHELKRTSANGTTKCELNGAPKKLNEYDAFVGGIFVTEERFKMFTMPLYFPESLHWTKQREILMKFFPEPTPAMVFGLWANETKQINWSNEFAAAMDTMQPADYMAKHDRMLKDCELRKIKIDAQIDLLDSQLEGTHDADIEEMTTVRNALRDEIHQHTERLKEVNDYNSKIFATKQTIVDRIDALKRERQSRIAESETILQKKRNTLEIEIAKQKERVLNLRKEFTDLSDRKIQTECPTCKQPLSVEAVGRMQHEIAATRSEVATQGSIAFAHMEKAIAELEALPSKSADVNTTDLDLEIESNELKLENLPPPKPVPEMDSTIYSQHDAISKALSRFDVHQENIKRRADLEAEERKLNTEIEQHDIAIKTAGMYIFYRSVVIIQEVNKHFKSISVKVFETLKNGVTKDTFEITSQGVPYSELNTAGQLEAGLELTTFLKEKMDITTPIFIDNGERYTDVNFGDLPGQIIVAEAKKGSKLKLEVKNG